MGYLVCEKCEGYYELKPGESIDDFESCECGGKLRYEIPIKEVNPKKSLSESKIRILALIIGFIFTTVLSSYTVLTGSQSFGAGIFTLFLVPLIGGLIIGYLPNWNYKKFALLGVILGFSIPLLIVIRDITNPNYVSQHYIHVQYNFFQAAAGGFVVQAPIGILGTFSGIMIKKLIKN